MWKRKIELTIFDKDTGNVLLSTTENRIDFVYQGMEAWMADTLTVEVYNLSNESLRLLLDTQRRNIRLEVGYEDEPASMSTLLDGYITNAAGRKAIPNHITTLWCIPHSAEKLSSTSNLNTLVYQGGNLQDLIANISKMAGYVSPPQYFGVDEDVLTTPILSYIMGGTVNSALRELGDQYGFYVRGSNSSLRLISKLNSKSTLKKIIQNEATYHRMSLDKLKGTPEASVQMINFVTNLDASIDCGDVVDVTDFIGARGTDKNSAPGTGVIAVNELPKVLFYSETLWALTIYEQYKVMQIQHVGSNYTPTWETRITGITFNEGLAGGKEVSGNGWGAGAWPNNVSAEVNKTQGTPNLSQSISTAGLTSKDISDLNMVKITPEQSAIISSASGGNKKKEEFLRDKLIVENRGNTSVKNAVSPKGATGPYQFMPETARNLGLTVNKDQDDRNDFGKSTAAAGKYYDELDRRYDGNIDAMNADYNGGPKQGVPVSEGREAPADQTKKYLLLDRALREARNGV